MFSGLIIITIKLCIMFIQNKITRFLLYSRQEMTNAFKANGIMSVILPCILTIMIIDNGISSGIRETKVEITLPLEIMACLVYISYVCVYTVKNYDYKDMIIAEYGIGAIANNIKENKIARNLTIVLSWITVILVVALVKITIET